MRIMGLDIGSKRVGVAVSDELGIAANAKDVFQYTGSKELIEKIKSYTEELKAASVVIGLPINMNGTIGKGAKEILELVEILKKELTVPVHIFDERLSTIRAQNMLIDANLSRKKRKKIIDSSSAQIILQDYLSMHKEEKA